MEVHHHSHTPSGKDGHHGRKKWSHYFWEFLMLFLAVFAGFLAEYKLEHVIEHQREKEYAKSLYDELYADSIVFDKKIKGRLDKPLPTIAGCTASWYSSTRLSCVKATIILGLQT